MVPHRGYILSAAYVRQHRPVANPKEEEESFAKKYKMIHTGIFVCSMALHHLNALIGRRRRSRVRVP